MGKIQSLEKPLIKFMKTEDNWCPNYENDTIKVSLYFEYQDWDIDIHPEYNMYHGYYVFIIVTGNDDTNMELSTDGPIKDKKEAETLYAQYLDIYKSLPEPLNMSWLAAHGFKPG